MMTRSGTGDNNPNPLSDALARCRAAFIAVALFSLVINLLMLTTAVYMLQIFDRVLASRSLETLAFLTVIAIGALAMLGLLDMLRMRVLGRLSVWLEQRLSPATLARALEAVLGNRDYRTEGLRDLADLRSFLGGPGAIILFDAPWVPVYIAFIYLLHPLLGHVALASAVVLFALALVNDAATRRLLEQANTAAARGLRATEANLRNAEVIDAMHMLPGVVRRWEQDNVQALDFQLSASDRGAFVVGLSKFFRLSAQIAVLGIGAWLVIRHELTGGGMIAGSIILGRALAPVEQAIGTWKQAVKAREAHRRLGAFFARPRLRPEGLPLPAPRAHLAVENVCYGLPRASGLILKGVSFMVQPGEAVAIIGPSAAGKSTLARLLVGSLRPTTGTVRLDGADLFAWRRDDVGQHIGYLPQDVELFAGRVAENIARMGDAEPVDIVAAARLAHAHHMILSLPHGYQTEIGEQGAFLSAGQRQRIALARALFGQPKLIVLDEPNANLDAEGEEALNGAIAAIKARSTAVVVIGHRPSILAQVDKVLVLIKGQVEQFGARAEVLERLTRRSLRPVPHGAQPEHRFGLAQAPE